MRQIEQIDMKAAADLLDKLGGIQRFEKLGISFAGMDNAMCEAFARHRLTALSDREARRAAMDELIAASADEIDIAARPADPSSVDDIANRLREAAASFDNPVDRYVEPEALIRWERANPDGDAWDHEPPGGWEMESWRILARAVARPAVGEDVVERVAGFRTLSIHKGKQIVIEYDDPAHAGRVFDALVKTMADGGDDAQSAAE